MARWPRITIPTYWLTLFRAATAHSKKFSDPIITCIMVSFWLLKLVSRRLFWQYGGIYVDALS